MADLTIGFLIDFFIHLFVGLIPEAGPVNMLPVVHDKSGKFDNRLKYTKNVNRLSLVIGSFVWKSHYLFLLDEVIYWQFIKASIVTIQKRITGDIIGRRKMYL